MNKFDLVILLIVLVFMLIGYYRGLVKSVLSVVQYFAVIFFAVVLAGTYMSLANGMNHIWSAHTNYSVK